MSQKPKGRSEARSAMAGGQAQKKPPADTYEEHEEYEEYEEYEEEPKPRGSQRRGGSSGAQQRRRAEQASEYETSSRNQPPRGRRTHYYDYEPPPRRDIFPYALGALIGAMVVGLMTLAFLIGSGGKSSSGQTGGSSAAGGAQSAGTLAPSNASGSTAGQDPPRIPLADFKKLYDDPNKRPLIIDVRAKQAYDEGHITGATSFPEAEVDTRVAKLPKDKLVVAYCQ